MLSVKAAEAAATSVSVQLGSLLSHLWSRMLPRSEQTDNDVLQMARIQLAESQNRVEMSRQETERMRILQGIVERESATASQAIELAKAALASPNPAYGRANLLGPRINEIVDELEAEEARSSEIENDRAALEAIEPEKLNKLTSRLRPMLPEMALPLKRSAETLSIEGGVDQKPLILLNPINVAGLTETEPEDEAVELEVHVRSYDRDRGVGKVTSPELPRQLNFVVPELDKPRLLPKVLISMQRQTVIFVCQRYFDKSGQPTSLLLEDILVSETSD